MTGQRIGYIRVSTFDQNPERQLEGVKVDRAFSDKASGKDVKRPQLEALISFARTGDTVEREGIALAKQRGAYRGRKKSLSSERIAELRQRVEAGEQKTKLAREFGISRETLYQYLRTDQ
ncbi:recombinase family protein [Pseudomonas aeruginosa]|uniref:recombinase family protein n=1 Tax=Pseudomonas aeruginosa TaxID=287 RepID=UPI000F87029F|nr:recombinase family protein [Pseudomonas aeruginosa]RUG30528.1 hypothetical protein IPC760_33765 [Pseudomonas aeruginosa]